MRNSTRSYGLLMTAIYNRKFYSRSRLHSSTYVIKYELSSGGGLSEVAIAPFLASLPIYVYMHSINIKSPVRSKVSIILLKPGARTEHRYKITFRIYPSIGPNNVESRKKPHPRLKNKKSTSCQFVKQPFRGETFMM